MNFIDDIKTKIGSLPSAPLQTNTGVVKYVGDNIVRASGLQSVAYGEIVEIETGLDEVVPALTFNLEQENVGLLLLAQSDTIAAGQTVRTTGKQLSINVSDEYLSRVVNVIGIPQDGRGAMTLNDAAEMPLEKLAPGVMERKSVTRPLQTGVLVIDAMVNIGKGQRELIIGDRQTGKTSLALDAMINQKDKDVICVYVAIGQKQSTVKQLIEKLKQTDSLSHSVIVSAPASDPVSLQYLAPYAGVSIAEYFMEKGKDVLIIYDDLTKHAWAYRQISLLFKRPPGREAYPGDVFYLHSRLLERACQLSDERGGGSITALPIIETQAGDVSGYIPTNVISITDGQIFLENELFNAGIKPAVNPGISVTRVGGAAQVKNLKKLSGSTKLDLAQYKELAAFLQFGGDLDPGTQQKLKRGAALTQLLIQPPLKPLSVADQVATMYAGNKGYIDGIDKEKIAEWTNAMRDYFKNYYFDLYDELNDGTWSEELENELRVMLADFIDTDAGARGSIIK